MTSKEHPTATITTPNSTPGQSGRFGSERVAAFRRNQWPLSSECALEPEQGAIAEPRWLWEAIAAEESPSSVEMEAAETDPNAGPDTGNEQKGGGSAALSGDDQRDDSAPDGIAASLRNSVT